MSSMEITLAELSERVTPSPAAPPPPSEPVTVEETVEVTPAEDEEDEDEGVPEEVRPDPEDTRDEGPAHPHPFFKKRGRK